MASGMLGHHALNLRPKSRHRKGAYRVSGGPRAEKRVTTASELLSNILVSVEGILFWRKAKEHTRGSPMPSGGFFRNHRVFWWCSTLLARCEFFAPSALDQKM